jgi:hypothetical protein
LRMMILYVAFANKHTHTVIALLYDDYALYCTSLYHEGFLVVKRFFI